MSDYIASVDVATATETSFTACELIEIIEFYQTILDGLPDLAAASSQEIEDLFTDEMVRIISRQRQFLDLFNARISGWSL